MFLRVAFLTMIVLFAVQAKAQFVFSGTVKNESGKALEGISVFINNTSNGTLTGADGTFTLKVATAVADVVFTGVGYKTNVVQVTPENVSRYQNITMHTDAVLMEGVVVQAPLKDGWEKWGLFFVETFIGRSDEAKQCKLENHKALKFYYDKNTNTLTARADEPLIVTNKALGYKIQYKLEEFRYESKTNITFFAGYPFFTPLKGSAKKQKEWEYNRLLCYTGGLMHFFRSLYRNTVDREGFVLQPAVRYVNAEKARVKRAMRDYALRGVKHDSAAFYDNIMAQPDSLEKIGLTIAADSVAFKVEEQVAGFYFENLLLVSYPKKKMSQSMARIANTGGTNIYSFIRLMSDEPLYVLQDGSYFNPANMLSENYWAVSERIGRMLPFDYKPTNN